MAWNRPPEELETPPRKADVRVHALDYDRVRQHIIDLHTAAATDDVMRVVSDFFQKGLLEVLSVDNDVPPNYVRFYLLNGLFQEKKLVDVYIALEDKSKWKKSVKETSLNMLSTLMTATEQGIIR